MSSTIIQERKFHVGAGTRKEEKQPGEYRGYKWCCLVGWVQKEAQAKQKQCLKTPGLPLLGPWLVDLLFLNRTNSKKTIEIHSSLP